MKRISIVALVCFALSPLAGSAQTHNPMAEKLINFTGKVHVLSKNCSHISEQELEVSREKQMALAQQTMGVGQEQFQVWYEQGQQEAASTWESLSSAQRKQTCGELDQIANTAAAPISR